MRRILHIVDSYDYAKKNCFQHQLLNTLSSIQYVETKQLNEVLGHNLSRKYDLVVSCLKQRTLKAMSPQLQMSLADTPVVVYDQDPWESFRDVSLNRSAYNIIINHLNVKTFAVTTKWWSDFIRNQGMPSIFVKMWVLPEYCQSEPLFTDRSITTGFIGTVHPHRKKLFDELETLGTNVIVQSGGMNYKGYLESLSRMQCFIHSEDSSINACGRQTNLGVGLWIKDVEAAARGCFSIRNRGSDSETYLDGIKTVMLYDDPSEVPALIEQIQSMDPEKRQSLIDETVQFIKSVDNWQETVQLLIT